MDPVWLTPWYAIETKDDLEEHPFLTELRRELPRGHILSGLRVTPIANRKDCDDVLFALDDGRVAIVHLTWSRKREPVPDHPSTKLFDSLERFIEDEMKPEHEDWQK